MPKIHRRIVRKQFWRDSIGAWQASDQSVRAFCAARGIAQATFYARRRELAASGRSSQTKEPAQPPTFAAVRVIPVPTAEVVLPTGLVVRVPIASDPAAVARLVAALGAAPC